MHPQGHGAKATLDRAADDDPGATRDSYAELSDRDKEYFRRAPLGTLEDKRRRLREPAVHTVTVEVRLVGFDGDGAHAVRLGDRDFAPYLDALRSDVVARILHDDPPAGRDVSRRSRAIVSTASPPTTKTTRLARSPSRHDSTSTSRAPHPSSTPPSRLPSATRSRRSPARPARSTIPSTPRRPRSCLTRRWTTSWPRTTAGPPPRIPCTFSTRTHPAIARTRTRTAPRARSPAGQRGREGQPGCPGQLGSRPNVASGSTSPRDLPRTVRDEAARARPSARFRACAPRTPTFPVRVGAPSWGRFAAHAPSSLRAADGTRADQSVGRHRRPRRSRDGRARGERGRGAHARSGPRRTRALADALAPGQTVRVAETEVSFGTCATCAAAMHRALKTAGRVDARAGSTRAGHAREYLDARELRYWMRAFRARARGRRSARIWAPPETG